MNQKKIDVYKINLRKNYRIKLGTTAINSKVYEEIGYEQGHREARVHFKEKDFQSATITYNVVEW